MTTATTRTTATTIQATADTTITINSTTTTTFIATTCTIRHTFHHCINATSNLYSQFTQTTCA